MIKQTMDYLSTNILHETVLKVSGRQEAIRFWNYPYDALEEAVVNALYHRDYSQHEPVEITIEPEGILILNCPGPDRSIPMTAIEKGDNLKSRRYRNRRLGEFLKELNLTEGRATGIPTIQDELRKNGSDKAVIETDEDRTYFLSDIPCHPYWHQDVGKDSLNDIVSLNILSPRQRHIIQLIQEIPHVTQAEIAKQLNVSRQTIYRDITYLSSIEMIRREGSNKKGYWIISMLH